jgi:hypothetical protein
VKKRGSYKRREEVTFAAIRSPSALACSGVETGDVLAEMKTSVVICPFFQVM